MGIYGTIKLPKDIMEYVKELNRAQENHPEVNLFVNNTLIPGTNLIIDREFSDLCNCFCYSCFEASNVQLEEFDLRRDFRGMVVCPDCGDKRCPRVALHSNKCKE